MRINWSSTRGCQTSAIELIPSLHFRSNLEWHWMA